MTSNQVASTDAQTPLISFQQVLRQRQEMEDNKNPVKKAKCYVVWWIRLRYNDCLLSDLS